MMIFPKKITVPLAWLMLAMTPTACGGPHPGATGSRPSLWANLRQGTQIKEIAASQFFLHDQKEARTVPVLATPSKPEPSKNLAANPDSREPVLVAQKSADHPSTGSLTVLENEFSNAGSNSPTTNFPPAPPLDTGPDQLETKALSLGGTPSFVRNLFTSSSGGNSGIPSIGSNNIQGVPNSSSASAANTLPIFSGNTGTANFTAANSSALTPASTGKPPPLLANLHPTSGTPPSGFNPAPAPLILPPQGSGATPSGANLPGTLPGNSSANTASNNAGLGNNPGTGNPPPPPQGTAGGGSENKIAGSGLSTANLIGANSLGSGFRQGDEGRSGQAPFLQTKISSEGLSSKEGLLQFNTWGAQSCLDQSCIGQDCTQDICSDWGNNQIQHIEFDRTFIPTGCDAKIKKLMLLATFYPTGGGAYKSDLIIKDCDYDRTPGSNLTQTFDIKLKKEGSDASSGNRAFYRVPDSEAE